MSEPEYDPGSVILAHGPCACLPTLQPGELAVCTDTEQVWAGGLHGNFLVGPTGGEGTGTGTACCYAGAMAQAAVDTDEVSLLRQWIADFKAAVAGAGTLAALKAAVAALPDVSRRTASQARSAAKSRVDTADADRGGRMHPWRQGGVRRGAEGKPRISLADLAERRRH